MPIDQPIATQFKKDGTQYAEGYTTPKSMNTVQTCSFAPERVIPIIFLPGIMGSCLRMNAERQTHMKKKNNVAWRPDNTGWAVGMVFTGPSERQLQLDPKTTVVDIYDPKSNPTGNKKESADERHDNAKVSVDDRVNPIEVTADTPLLCNDPITASPCKTAKQKARERGWGEVFFDSYGDLLNKLEARFNLAYLNGKLNPDWKDIVGVDPAKLELAVGDGLTPLTEDELKQVMTNCWYPVHAFGYNWLQSNGVAAKEVATRINKLMDDYKSKHFQCEKVIIVTHSMGGLVGRALCHPQIGNMQDSILGIVHGVMPAIGAAAAYKRMRSGFEGSWFSPVKRVLGNTGPRVTAVLANSPGGLQLLPSEDYGNGWLKIVTKKGKVLKEIASPLPMQGDPYREIYSHADKWWGLLREEWINPAKDADSCLAQTKTYLKTAKSFHETISKTYHPVSFAHYGADVERKAFQTVTWQVDDDFPIDQLDTLQIVEDDLEGEIKLVTQAVYDTLPKGATQLPVETDMDGRTNVSVPYYTAKILSPREPGDETVPVYSADHQMRSKEPKFKGIFRQTGYEHQDSYSNEKAVASTLYSIVRIAQQMKWKNPC